MRATRKNFRVGARSVATSCVCGCAMHARQTARCFPSSARKNIYSRPRFSECRRCFPREKICEPKPFRNGKTAHLQEGSVVVFRVLREQLNIFDSRTPNCERQKNPRRS